MKEPPRNRLNFEWHADLQTEKGISDLTQVQEEDQTDPNYSVGVFGRPACQMASLGYMTQGNWQGGEPMGVTPLHKIHLHSAFEMVMKGGISYPGLGIGRTNAMNRSKSC